jgi:hypothetical protein
MPQSQGDNPVEQREEDSNDKGAQEKVSEENDFFAFHVFIDYFARSERCAPIFPSDTVAAVCERRRRKRTFDLPAVTDRRYSRVTNLREFAKSMYQLRACESAK